MKKMFLSAAILTCLLFASCSAKTTEPSPEVPDGEPSPIAQEQESPESSGGQTESKVFDLNGEVIKDENGHIDGLAAIDGMGDFTNEELIKLYPYSDGAVSEGLFDELAHRLMDDFEGLAALIAKAEIPEERGGTGQLAWYVGYYLKYMEDSDAVQTALSKDWNLSENEKAIVEKIAEGYETE